MNKPKICINLKDRLADVYAFSTLFNYLTENGFEAEVSVVYNTDNELEKFRELTKSNMLKPFNDNGLNIDHDISNLILRGYSDVPSGSSHNSLIIDLSILKNCVKPTTEEERIELRKKHDISLEEKVLVLGCPSFIHGPCEELKNIILELYSDYKIFVVGSLSDGFAANIWALPQNVKKSVECISDYGVLKDYYAMAEVSLINRNVVRNCDTMHNFIEATAGGPLFMVPPEEYYIHQFGYKQLVERRVIREAKNTGDLIAKVKKYLKQPNGETVREQRRQHLESSRELYLKDLHRLINKLLRIKDEHFESDLEIRDRIELETDLQFSAQSLTIVHPETNWSKYSSHVNNRPLKSLNGKTLDDRCFRAVEGAA